MPDLHPTKTRLALLREVAGGDVWQDSDGESFIGAGPRVTARMRELESAGWVRLLITNWVVTTEGYTVLATAAVRAS